jgi:hypothetical protein
MTNLALIIHYKTKAGIVPGLFSFAAVSVSAIG